MFIEQVYFPLCYVRKKKNMTTKKVNKRKIVSLLLLATLLMMPISALIVHVTHGTATSHKWLHYHTFFGILFVVVGIFHVIYNWKVLKNYFFGKKV